MLTIELISPDGQARFETPAGEVTGFLRRAWQIAPDGQESGHIDLDAQLNDLPARRHKRVIRPARQIPGIEGASPGASCR